PPDGRGRLRSLLHGTGHAVHPGKPGEVSRTFGMEVPGVVVRRGHELARPPAHRTSFATTQANRVLAPHAVLPHRSHCRAAEQARSDDSIAASDLSCPILLRPCNGAIPLSH